MAVPESADVRRKIFRRRRPPETAAVTGHDEDSGEDVEREKSCVCVCVFNFNEIK